MKKVAVLITVFNRVDKTLSCLKNLFEVDRKKSNISFKVFLTDDGSTDGTAEKVSEFAGDREDVEILQGDGQLYWNGGMNNSWRAAIEEGGFEGYLWLNNDTLVYSNLWEELKAADDYSLQKFGKGGIYVGSTYNKEKTALSYGGFNFKGKWTLQDEFVIPNGTFQKCQAAHGNITYVSHDVAIERGILCDEYLHSGGDHDYTYLAYKHDLPLFILRDFVGECENDHKGSAVEFNQLSLKGRFKYLKSPLGFNMHNTLLFQKRCFPHRYLPVLLLGYSRALFPRTYYAMYKRLRKK